jgi:hypothetical protein
MEVLWANVDRPGRSTCCGSSSCCRRTSRRRCVTRSLVECAGSSAWRRGVTRYEVLTNVLAPTRLAQDGSGDLTPSYGRSPRSWPTAGWPRTLKGRLLRVSCRCRVATTKPGRRTAPRRRRRRVRSGGSAAPAHVADRRGRRRGWRRCPCGCRREAIYARAGCGGRRR